MTPSLFGTDGIRGLANGKPMTAEIILAVGRATAQLLAERRLSETSTQNTLRTGPLKIVIGKDTRQSGYMVESALVAGLCSMGAKVFLVGPLPTPAIAFITQSMRADGGIMITASHNPFPYNGLKIFDSGGRKLSVKHQEQIEYGVAHPEHLGQLAPYDKVGKAVRIDDALGRYIVNLKNIFLEGATLDGLKIVLDCAHGAAYKVGPIVLEELGASVIAMNCSPNGTNINHECGAIAPQAMAKRVLEEKADMGFALDGDGDRLVVADETGALWDGDDLLFVCARGLLRDGALAHNTVVTTQLSNRGLAQSLAPLGGRVVYTPVGDRFVVDQMQVEGACLGGENSGHVICGRHATTADGLGAALTVLAEFQKGAKPMSQLRKGLERLPQVSRNLAIQHRRDFTSLRSFQNVLSKVEESLDHAGRVLVRYSGTEPLVRIMVEGKDRDHIEKCVEELSSTLAAELNVASPWNPS